MSNFIDDDLAIEVKVDAISIPTGANSANYLDDEWANLLRQAAYDLRTRSVEHGDSIDTLITDLDAAELTISGHTSSLASLDGRITALEEAPGGGDSLWSAEDADTATMAGYSNTILDTLAGATRDDPSGLTLWRNGELTNDPQFGAGNPYIAGIGYEAFGFYYKDDLTPLSLILSIERTGTMAPVHDGVRRPSFEAYIQNGDEKPWTRTDSSSQSIQFGSGGHVALAGNATRSGTTLTVTTETEHKLTAGQLLFKQTIGGAAQYGSDGEWLTVASVVDADTFTVTVPNSGITSNTLSISFSAESFQDTEFGRGAYATPEIRAGGSTIYQGNSAYHRFLLADDLKLDIQASKIRFPAGVPFCGATMAFNPGNDSFTTLSIGQGLVTVAEGATFKNLAATQSAIWVNSGGQTQGTQRWFVVDTSSGNKTTTIEKALEGDGSTNGFEYLIRNKGTNTLTIAVQSGDTINGASTYDLGPNETALVVSSYTNWEVAVMGAP